MLALFLKFCEYVFPERVEHRIVRELLLDDLLTHLCPTERDNIVSLLPFNEPIVRAVVHEAKFRHNEKAWELLGAVLAQYLKHYGEDTILIPIPLSEKRRRSRKYNQVEEVAKRAYTLLPYQKLNNDTLFRKRDTVPQTTLTRKERLINMAGAFGVRHSRELKNQDVIIIDDVTTTGATLKAAKLALEPHHPTSITLLSLAH